jgi:hypothetical protein
MNDFESLESHQPEDGLQETPMSPEVAEHVQQQSRDAGKLGDRIFTNRHGIELPSKPSLKDRLEADRVLREEDSQEDK